MALLQVVEEGSGQDVDSVRWEDSATWCTILLHLPSGVCPAPLRFQNALFNFRGSVFEIWDCLGQTKTYGHPTQKASGRSGDRVWVCVFHLLLLLTCPFQFPHGSSYSCYFPSLLVRLHSLSNWLLVQSVLSAFL